jgi:TetR/AcrR family transcriptional regulator, transcriptional repressor for nem operon
MARPTLHDKSETLGRAIHVFWRKGFSNTSIKDLEMALDMRPGSIYASFDSKAGLFTQALSVYATHQADKTRSVIQAQQNPLDGLLTLLCCFAQEKPDGQPSYACFLVKSLLEMENDEGEMKNLIRQHLLAMESIFSDAFSDAISMGYVADPDRPEHAPSRLARMLQTKIIGIRIMSLQLAQNDLLRELTDDCAQFIEELKKSPDTEILVNDGL